MWTIVRKEERQRAQFERELRIEVVEPISMRLGEFMKDSLARTGDQIRESTHEDYESSMKDFIKVVGNIDYQKVTLEHGEFFYRQNNLDKGNSGEQPEAAIWQDTCKSRYREGNFP